MAYAELGLIASEIVKELEKLKIFRSVEYVQATSGAQVYARCQALTAKPCALVTIGAVSYSEEVLMRDFRVMIFVIDKFQKSFKGEADTLWELSEKIVNLFLPRRDNAGDLSGALLAGATILPEGIVPIETKDNISCCCVNLIANDFLLEE